MEGWSKLFQGERPLKWCLKSTNLTDRREGRFEKRFENDRSGLGNSLDKNDSLWGLRESNFQTNVLSGMGFLVLTKRIERRLLREKV